jgi:hypothetical protein
MRYVFDAELWQWQARTDGWTFVSLPPGIFDEIRELAGVQPRGFGSVKVTARIGDTRWATSIFPDTKSGTFVLPIKKAVKVAEGIDHGDVVAVELDLQL